MHFAFNANFAFYDKNWALFCLSFKKKYKQILTRYLEIFGGCKRFLQTVSVRATWDVYSLGPLRRNSICTEPRFYIAAAGYRHLVTWAISCDATNRLHVILPVVNWSAVCFLKEKVKRCANRAHLQQCTARLPCRHPVCYSLRGQTWSISPVSNALIDDKN